jgi:GMP synthase (glutamine-hydrolysing)
LTRKLLILKTGSTFAELARQEGDFEDWTRAGLEVPKELVRVIDARESKSLPVASEIAGIVITGSHEMVTDAVTWLTWTSTWLAHQVSRGTPVLGICFGHQLLAQALGGVVGWQPGGREIGTMEITLSTESLGDPLLSDLPKAFPAHCSHAQSVLKLPRGAVALARSESDPHHAFRYGERAWGIQFHPEFSVTVMRAYIERHRIEVTKRGLDADQLIASVRPSPSGVVLKRFGGLAQYGDAPDAGNQNGGSRCHRND